MYRQIIFTIFAESVEKHFSLCSMLSQFLKEKHKPLELNWKLWPRPTELSKKMHKKSDMSVSDKAIFLSQDALKNPDASL